MRSLAGEFQPFLIDSWISKLIPEFDGNELLLLAPNAFHKGRVRETLLPTIQTLVCQELVGYNAGMRRVVNLTSIPALGKQLLLGDAFPT